MQAGDFHRQCVMAGRHARAALQHHPIRRRCPKQSAKCLAQFVRGLEAAIGGQVVLEKAIQRARNMAADRIERLVLSAIPVRGTGID